MILLSIKVSHILTYLFHQLLKIIKINLKKKTQILINLNLNLNKKINHLQNKILKLRKTLRENLTIVPQKNK